MKDQRIEELQALIKEWREISQRVLDEEEEGGLECEEDTATIARLTAALACALPDALDEIARLRHLIECAQMTLQLVRP